MLQLKTIREDANLRQVDIANVIGIDRSTYSSYEIQRDPIPINHLNNLCNYFDISIDYAFCLTKTRKYENSRENIDRALLSARLKTLRKDNLLTQNAIADELNTSRSAWTGYEYGKYQIPTLFLYALARKYHYSMDYLLGKIDENPLNK